MQPLLTEQDHEDAIEFEIGNYDRPRRARAYRQRGYGTMVYLQRMPPREACRQWLLDHAAGGWRVYLTCFVVEFAFRDPAVAVAFKLRWG